MNATIELLRKHRSIREYKNTDVPKEHVEEIVRAAQAASTSSNIQAYSVVGVRDPERKRRLAELSGNQKHIVECPVFLVWCADLNRIRTAVRLHEETELEQNVESFLLATVDATLAAQNAAIAAESLGYGIVYIGGIRNNPQEVSDLLGLPELVYPVFGMCLGVPAANPDIRPRLPLSAIYHEEVYSQKAQENGIKEYDETTSVYYVARRGGDGRTSKWSQEMHRRFKSGRLRDHLHGYLHGRGFKLK